MPDDEEHVEVEFSEVDWKWIKAQAVVAGKDPQEWLIETVRRAMISMEAEGNLHGNN